MSLVARYAIVLLFAAPRIDFIRTMPARHDIVGERAAVIYALGDNEKVLTFVEIFLSHTNREGSILRVDDAPVSPRGPDVDARRSGSPARGWAVWRPISRWWARS